MRSALGCGALGVLLLLVAGTFDAEPLYVTGSVLVLLGGGSAGWIGLGARGAGIRRELDARSVVEEQPLAVRLEVTGGRLRLPPGYVDDPLLPEPVRVPTGGRRARVRVDITFGRRGRRKLAPPALVLRDPFGLAERVISAGHSDELLVLPRLYPVRVAAGAGDSSTGRSRAILTTAAETEIDGLRPYREGTPGSRIHWQALARGAGMMERKLIAEADSRPIVVLDPRGAGSPDDLDAAVRAAGSLVHHFAQRRGCALLLPGDRRATVIDRDLLAWPPAHVRLAIVDDRSGPALTAAQNRRGLVVFVAARVIDRVPRGLGRTTGGSLLVVPGELPGRRPVLEVAGCRGYFGARTGSGAAMAAVEGGA